MQKSNIYVNRHESTCYFSLFSLPGHAMLAQIRKKKRYSEYKCSECKVRVFDAIHILIDESLKGDRAHQCVTSVEIKITKHFTDGKAGKPARGIFLWLLVTLFTHAYVQML